jgi:Zn-dependent M28 family amino/carboxypeptidase
MRYNSWFGCIVELIPEELMWSVSTKVQTYPVVKIKRESFDKKTQMIKLNSKSEYVNDFEARNVIGYVEGEKDEFIVFTAHYDHLGWMGKDVFIPGAQDNASGTALVLDLADYYSKNKPEYSIAFMLFFGEEAGLFGSTYYVMNPLFDLKKIKAVFNLDMVGTGDDGITVVNGAEEDYKDIWNLIDKINKENEFFTEIKARKESANSDHYPFHAKGVKAVFIYTMGGKTYYHNPKDKPETLTFTGYNQLFGLLTKFVEEYE